jgi:uncharacterized membrane protein
VQRERRSRGSVALDRNLGHVLVTEWMLVRFLHVLGATLWVGGQLVLSGLVLPVLRARLGAEQRAPIGREVGRRFGLFTLLVFLPVQVLTGLVLAAGDGVRWTHLGEDSYGRTLAAKLVLVALVLVLSGLHGLAVARNRPVVGRALAMATLAGSVGIVLLATALAG